MVTNYPHDMAAHPMTDAGVDSSPGLLARATGAVRHALCSLRGHDNLLHFEQNRMYLRCTSCGHETPGWQIDEKPPRRRFHGDPRRMREQTASRFLDRRIA